MSILHKNIISLKLVESTYLNEQTAVAIVNTTDKENGTYLQQDSPLGEDTQAPPFRQGLGEHDTNPAKTTTMSNNSVLTLNKMGNKQKDHLNCLFGWLQCGCLTT